MKKRNFLLCCFLVFVSVFFVSCATNKSSSSEEISNTQEPLQDSVSSSTPMFDDFIEAEDNKIIIENEDVETLKFFYEPNEHFFKDVSYSIDLDLDGTLEEIFYTIENEKIKLSINDVNFSNYFKQFKNPLDYFYILDLKLENNFLILVFGNQENGSFSSWFRYNDDSLILLGSLDKFPDEEIYFKENGKFSIYNKIDIFEPNFIEIEYEIIDNNIDKIFADIYKFEIPCIRDNNIKVKDNLIVRLDRKLDLTEENMFVIPKDSEIEITHTDGESFVNVLYYNKEYWLKIENKILVDNNEILISDMFENILY